MLRSRLLLLLSLLPRFAQAQTWPSLATGARVRVTAAHLGIDREIRQVSSTTADTLVLQSMRIPFPAIDRLELSVGRKSQWVKGLAVGGLLGAIAGAAVGSAEIWGDTGVHYTGELGLTGAVIGGGIGTLVGLAFHSDRWRVILTGTPPR